MSLRPVALAAMLACVSGCSKRQVEVRTAPATGDGRLDSGEEHLESGGQRLDHAEWSGDVLRESGGEHIADNSGAGHSGGVNGQPQGGDGRRITNILARQRRARKSGTYVFPIP